MQKNNLLMLTGVVTTVVLMACVQAEQDHAHNTHMEQGMAAIGAEMHRAASRFAVAASDAAVEA